MGFSAFPTDPHKKSWMLFADGENLTIRAQRVFAEYGLEMPSGDHHEEDVFAWIPNIAPHRLMGSLSQAQTQDIAVRAYFYTTTSGDSEQIRNIRDRLWKLGFHPEVFHKPRNLRAKGVDITLTKDMLSHAFLDNYAIAVLLAGDGDYVPLVQEVKRLGKVVFVGSFLGSGFNDDLRLASDWTFDLTRPFLLEWLRFLGGSEEDLSKPLPSP